MFGWLRALVGHRGGDGIPAETRVVLQEARQARAAMADSTTALKKEVAEEISHQVAVREGIQRGEFIIDELFGPSCRLRREQG